MCTNPPCMQHVLIAHMVNIYVLSEYLRYFHGIGFILMSIYSMLI